MTPPSGSVETLVIVVATLVGLFVGSFLNVVVYRAPLGLSVSTPRSFCPTCDRQLEWWENIPLASWLALRGECHTCHQPISARYPAVECTTAVTFGLVAWAWHGSALTVGYCLLAATVVAGALIEWGGARTPLSVGATGAGLGAIAIVVAASWTHRWPVLVWSLCGLVAAAALFAVLRMRDPDCRDPRAHGRALLPAAGCWLGGLGGVHAAAAVAGLAGWILGAFACLVVLWRTDRAEGRETAATAVRRGVATSVASVPLVTGLVLALAASLAVAG